MAYLKIGENIKNLAFALIAFGGIAISSSNALANPWGLDPVHLTLSKREWNKVFSVTIADMILGCAVKRGMLKPEHYTKYANPIAKRWALSEYGITMTDSDINYSRTRPLGPGPPHKYKEHLAETIQELGGCAAVINLSIASPVITKIREVESGYSNQAPLGDLMEGTPFEW